MSANSNNSTVADTGGDNLEWWNCFEAAIGYFTSHLDTQISDHTESGDHSHRPSTAREYFHERGWGDETIDRHHLGWSPAGDTNTLRRYLEQRGFSEEEILATGLFSKDLEPLWNGRYVFPYLDTDGRPTYAISRATGEETHPEDFMSGKYAKLAHTKEYACVSEPIFGLRTIRENEPVVITEGIADAITVHRAGYPCISPVTTQFKRSDQDALLSVLNEHAVSRIYVLQDAEQPGSSFNKEQSQLEIDQFGPGVKGAVNTATFLTGNGLDARVNTPPRIGRRKVDLDDYLREKLGTLEPLLRSAKPPHQHPAYAEPEDQVTAPPTESQSSVVADSENQSALFSLDITDVTGLRVNFRGMNPLGHAGDSENYFVVFRDDWAYDHKRKAGYNPLTYLLCQADERSLDDPQGSLTDRERFVAWKYAKDQGLLVKDDPIPHDALIYIALEHGLCEQEEIEDGWRLPLEAYNTALDVVRDEYGLKSGRESYDSAISTGKLSGVPVVSDNQQTMSGVTLDEAWDRCQGTISRALAHSRNPLIDALPGQGKSRGIIEWAADTETPLTVLTPRNELHEQNKPWCHKFGLVPYHLPAFHRDCGCATGEHGDTWQKWVMLLYRAGATGGEIHELAEKRFDRELPCMQNGGCSYLSKWDFDPDNFDVLLGNYAHAYRDKVCKDRVVALDETPRDAFLKKFRSEKVNEAVTRYLKSHDDLPFGNYTDLIENRTDPCQYEAAIEWFQQHNEEVKRNGFPVMTDQSGRADAYAPMMTYALLVGKDLGNEWEHATLPQGQVAARDRNPNTERGEPELILLLPPSFEDAENVIGLDGTPCVEQWELCLGQPVNHHQVFDNDERAAYIQDTLNQSIYMMCETSKPYSSGEWLRPDEDSALIKQVPESEDTNPDLITSKSWIDKFKPGGLLEGVDKWKYYGDLIGSNDFRSSRLGLVLGSPHYGDKYVKMWGAFAEEAVERIGDGNGMDLDYGSFGNKILQDMRENEVLQAIMRFGRDGDGATIYVSTAAIPEWVPLAGEGKVITWSNGMIQVQNAIRDRDEWRTSDLLTETEDRETRVLDTDASETISGRQVRRNLDQLCDLGFLDKRKEGVGWIWEDAGMERTGKTHQVVFK